MKPIFSHASGTINFSQLAETLQHGLEVLQPTEESASGVRFGYDPICAEELIPLRWARLPLADLQDLEAFFATVDGMAETFTYTDAAGLGHIVRFAAPELSYVEIAFERFAITVQLRKEF